MEDSITARLKRLVTSSNEVLEFRLIRSVDDLDSKETVFKPEMTYQVFGDRFVIKMPNIQSLFINKYYTERLYIKYIYVHKLSVTLFICCREIIFGYQDLKVQLFYSAGCLETYLGMTYTEKVNTEYEGVEADEVLTKIAAKLAPDVHYSETNFINALTKDDTFTPYGKLIHSFSLNGISYIL